MGIDSFKDENGNTGIKWLKNNLKNIKIKSTDSDKRDDIIKFINEKGDQLCQKEDFQVWADLVE